MVFLVHLVVGFLHFLMSFLAVPCTELLQVDPGGPELGKASRSRARKGSSAAVGAQPAMVLSRMGVTPAGGLQLDTWLVSIITRGDDDR